MVAEELRFVPGGDVVLSRSLSIWGQGQVVNIQLIVKITTGMTVSQTVVGQHRVSNKVINAQDHKLEKID